MREGDSIMLGWSLISGAVPVVLLIAGCAGLGFLLAGRRDRRWWRTVAALVIAMAAAVVAMTIAVSVLAPFPDPVPAIVWWSAGAVLLAASLAVALLVRPGRAARLPALLAAAVVALAAGNQVNLYFGQYPTLDAAIGLPVANQVELARVARVSSTLVTRVPNHPLAQAWQPPPGVPAAGVLSPVVIPAPASGFAARPAWLYLPAAYLTMCLDSRLGRAAAFAAVNPLDLLAAHRYPATAGFIAAGTGDALYRPQAELVARAARRAGLRIDYRLLPGGHDWRLARSGLDAALPWLAARLGLTP